MPNPLIARFERVARLTSDDREALRALGADTRAVAAHRDIIREGDRPDHVHLMLEGWAARYKVVAGGARQITAFLIPGDFCDFHVTILREMDHGIQALTPARVAYVSPRAIEELLFGRPGLARALWWATLVDAAILRTWIVTLGRRDAYEGLAHLMCELHARMRAVGLADDDRFELPLTQEVLADALGLTAVHVNRVLQRLRRAGLVRRSGGTLAVLDVAALRRVAGFDPAYLHAEAMQLPEGAHGAG